MQIKTKLFAAALTLFSTISFAQDSLKNSIFLEVLGNAGYYSLNYERQLKNQFVVRTGLSIVEDGIIIPAMAGKFWGKSSHHFELNGGFVFARVKEYKETEFIATVFAGYRFQKRRFLFRAGLTPLINISNGISLLSGGISFGYRF